MTFHEIPYNDSEETMSLSFRAAHFLVPVHCDVIKNHSLSIEIKIHL